MIPDTHVTSRARPDGRLVGLASDFSCLAGDDARLQPEHIGADAALSATPDGAIVFRAFHRQATEGRKAAEAAVDALRLPRSTSRATFLGGSSAARRSTPGHLFDSDHGARHVGIYEAHAHGFFVVNTKKNEAFYELH